MTSSYYCTTSIIIKNLNLEGVYLLSDSSRYYPYETTLAHTLGFVGVDNQGLAGIEAYYNEFLPKQKEEVDKKPYEGGVSIII